MPEYAVFIGCIEPAPGAPPEDDDGFVKMRSYLYGLMDRGAIREFSRKIINNPDHLPSGLPEDGNVQRLLEVYIRSLDECRKGPNVVVFEAEVLNPQRLDLLTKELYERYGLELRKYRK